MSDIASSDPAVRPVIPPGTAGSPGDDVRSDVPSVVIVDADDRTRASLVGLLGIRGRVRVLGDAAQAKAAVNLIRDCHPDVIVLDPRLPDLEGGLLAIHTIRTLDPDIRILAMGPQGNVEMAAAEAGADAFVRKTFRPDELADAVVRCATVKRSAPERPETGRDDA
jgi:DNA-binding NarL/FixJ family response regulator